MWFDFHLEFDPPRAGKPEPRFPSGFAMRNARRWFRILGSLVAINLACAPESRLHAQGVPQADRPVDFARDVQPILQQRCHKCHGGVRRRSGLSLLERDDVVAALPSGARAVVPGEPETSELFLRVSETDETLRMPPTGNPLTEKEIGILRRWITEGARWTRHWSFQPVRRPATPAVKQEEWARNSIDRFVLARLEAAGISPSPEADRSTLIRRLSLDLTGLLPAVDEVDAFCSDPRPDYYERLVERLLASPHFGERWGRHWLDQARYADTDGFEVDGPRPSAWRWRDWVIAAFNEDMPFDRFTIEQIAGDLLPDATPMQRLATAFHRQSLTNREGGIDQGEARYKELVDRVNATATVWLGLTVGCAQCHDHPYDPYTQREFFGLYAFFNDTVDTEVVVPTNRTIEPPRGTNRQRRRTNPNEVEALIVGQSKEPRTATMYRRGDYLQPGDAVGPGTFRALPPLPPEESETAVPDRLDLARWIVDPANPLMPRVAANQLWIRLFGEGLVRTPDDFGARGEPPTHPQLLDWLADEYRAAGWGTKRMIRLIVTSATYRQSSRHRPELRQVDPLNALWHRQNRFRVEAEIVRDLHLDAAGLLTREIGGPGIYPPLSREVAKLSFRSNYVWTVSTGGDLYRRGMYVFYKRTLPHPNLDTFDCPDSTTALMRREISNTPLQALAALNNEVHVESARAFASRILSEGRPADRDRIDNAFRHCLSRHPTDAERKKLSELLGINRRWYAEHDEDAASLVGAFRPPDVDDREAAAWVATLGVILNLDEFLTRE